MSSGVRALLRVAAFLALWAGFTSGIVLAALAIGGPDFHADLMLRAAVEAGGAIAATLALLIMAVAVERRAWHTVGLRLSRAVTDLPLGALVGVGIFLIPIASMSALGFVKPAASWASFSWPVLGYSLALAALNAYQQELLVRSYIFQTLRARSGDVAAALATTALFVALHAGALMGNQGALFAAANLALAGIMLSAAILSSGELWLSIGIHFGWNAMSGPVLGIARTEMEKGLGTWTFFAIDGPQALTSGTAGIESGLIGLAGPAIGLLIVLFLIRQRATE